VTQKLNSNKCSIEQLLAMIANNANIQKEIKEHAVKNPSSHWRIMDIEHEIHFHLKVELDFDENEKCSALESYFNSKHEELTKED
jgi:hypothetical protein